MGCLNMHLLLPISIPLYKIAASAPTQLSAIQLTATSVNVSWIPHGRTTGYIIYYSGVSSGIMLENIDDKYSFWHTLTGLQNGETYNISIVGTSTELPSQPLYLGWVIGLGKRLIISLDDMYSISHPYSSR